MRIYDSQHELSKLMEDNPGEKCIPRFVQLRLHASFPAPHPMNPCSSVTRLRHFKSPGSTRSPFRQHPKIQNP
jgi:hypothetical protein